MLWHVSSLRAVRVAQSCRRPGGMVGFFEDLVIPWPYMRLGSEDSGVDRWISTPLATSALILSPDYFAYLPCRCHTYHTYIIVPHHHT